MNILIAPDKFKDSLSAFEVCEAIELGLRKIRKDLKITKLPLADGGEGTLDILEKSLDLELVEIEVHDPLFRKIKASYGKKANKAYVEMAKASGLELLDAKERYVMSTTSLGTGELIVDAVKNGAKEVFLFVGGSATNDGGIGVLHALGYRFLDEDGQGLQPVGGSLTEIRSIVSPAEIQQSYKIFLVTDVKNPLIGTTGAAQVFGAQKGATREEISILDSGLENLSQCIQRYSGKSIVSVPGVGAAGGLGACLVGILDAEISLGISTVFSSVGFDQALSTADLVITGEGKLDGQTFGGKVISGVLEKATEKNVRSAIICGVLEGVGSNPLLNELTILELMRPGMSAEYSMKNAFDLIVERVSEGLKWI